MINKNDDNNNYFKRILFYFILFYFKSAICFTVISIMFCCSFLSFIVNQSA